MPLKADGNSGMSDGDRSNDFAPDRLRSSDARRDASRHAEGCQSSEDAHQNSTCCDKRQSRHRPSLKPTLAFWLAVGRCEACGHAASAALSRRMTTRRLETARSTPAAPRDRQLPQTSLPSTLWSATWRFCLSPTHRSANGLRPNGPACTL
jgi:hypothetical protein